MGMFKRLEYFDTALQCASETAVVKMLTESLSGADLNIHAEHPIKHWKSVFCVENEQNLKQEILKILYIEHNDDGRCGVYDEKRSGASHNHGCY